MVKDINIVRIFNAPREKVWTAWTTPELIKQWFAPKPLTCPSANVDLRVGGKYLHAMRDPSGKLFWSGGVYKEIRKPELIVASDYFANEKGEPIDPNTYGMGADFPKEGLVRTTFEDVKGKTRLTVHYEPKTQAAYDAMLKTGMIEGWNMCLDNLAAVVEPKASAQKAPAKKKAAKKAVKKAVKKKVAKKAVKKTAARKKK
jgi:uncharacterized protein YndB with AHSA1/START domain